MIRSRRTAIGVALAGLLAALVPAAPAMAARSGHAPTPRYYHSMAYDAANGQVVIFGGEEAVISGFLTDTWTWDGTDWTQRHPAHSPSGRLSPGMAYDATNGTVVLFGGYVGTALGDTWTWDGTDWTQQHPAHSPPPRSTMGMTDDASHGNVILFGGVDDNGALSDTWTWDGTDWTQQHPAHSPAPTGYITLSSDADGHVVLFGGYHGHALDQTWTWDGTDWTERTPAHHPAARYGQAMTYDSATRQAVLFGGDLPERRDTWTWDGTDWAKQAPPTRIARTRFPAMAFDAATGQVVLFGGLHPRGWNTATWLWNGADWTRRPSGWIALDSRSGPPGSRVRVKGWGFAPAQGVQLTFVDSVHGRILLRTTWTNSLGRFRISITIPATATAGRQRIMATVASGIRSRDQARRGFTVT